MANPKPGEIQTNLSDQQKIKLPGRIGLQSALKAILSSENDNRLFFDDDVGFRGYPTGTALPFRPRHQEQREGLRRRFQEDWLPKEMLPAGSTSKGFQGVGLPTKKPKREFRSPRWLEGKYRPRALTAVGSAALEKLGPGGEGLSVYPIEELASLAARRDYLARRYIGLDLLRQGLVVESLGTYFNAAARRSGGRGGGPISLGLLALSQLQESTDCMDERELLLWLGMGRAMTLDQIISLDPENARNNRKLLQEFENSGVLRRDHLSFPKGVIGCYLLEPKGWKWLQKEYPDIGLRGFGPRRLGIGNRDHHETLITDALIFFIHETVAQGGTVLDISLERGLRRENTTRAGVPKGERYPDFRIRYETERGLREFFDVEVIGIGSGYRGRPWKDRIQGQTLTRIFSSASTRIQIGDDVVIGR